VSRGGGLPFSSKWGDGMRNNGNRTAMEKAGCLLRKVGIRDEQFKDILPEGEAKKGTTANQKKKE